MTKLTTRRFFDQGSCAQLDVSYAVDPMGRHAIILSIASNDRVQSIAFQEDCAGRCFVSREVLGALKEFVEQIEQATKQTTEE